MEIVFLDDSRERAELVKTKFPQVEWVTNVQDCIDRLKNNKVENLMLDHDMGEALDSGMKVVEYLEEQPKRDDIEFIVVHSDNPLVNKQMTERLQKVGYNTASCPFSKMTDALKKLATEESAQKVSTTDSAG